LGVIYKKHRRQTMDEIITGFVGLDAHAESTAIGFAEAGRAAPRFVGTVGAKLAELKRALGKLGEPGSLLIVYEAGPCGYALARDLATSGYRCEVVAPSRIPRRPGERVKTDRRDALNLASLARAGELTSVTIPDERDEAIRDLSRARVDAVRARLKARQQLKALMLRHGRRYTGKTSWTAAHERHLAVVSFEHAAQNIAFTEYRQAVSEGEARVRRLGECLAREVELWRSYPVVSALMTLRGFELIAATTVIAELGDLRRFAHPRDLMGYLGLVPSEHTSGSKRRLGAITKTGNGHVRRVLIEAAWNYRFPARLSRALQIRQENQPQPIREIAWRAQLRLSYRYRRLKARGLQHNKICVALARELAAFVWDIARHVAACA
jgi:transposase